MFDPDVRLAADNFLDTAIPQEVQVFDADTKEMLIRKEALDDISNGIMGFIAEVVSSLINAGSERDAVIENDRLRQAIYDELRSWSDGTDA